MKRLILSTVLVAVTIAASQAMSYTEARDRALFLTDKMAYELGLNESQYDAAYEINLDYLMSLSTQDDILGRCWYRRNLDLGYVLTATQYGRYVKMEYFYRPVYWSSGFRYRIYTRYKDAGRLFFSRPSVFTTYRGGHSWHSNGGKSWYKGRTFSSGKKMKEAKKPKKNKTATKRHSQPAKAKPAPQKKPARGNGASRGTAVERQGHSFSVRR